MGLNNIEVKRVNRNNLLRYMLKADQISKSNAARELHLSIPTVTQCLNDLLAVGLAQEVGSMESIGGRKSAAYRCVKDVKCAIGVDITRSHVNIVIINLALDLLYSKRVNMRLYDEPASYGELKAIIDLSVRESGIDVSSILGLGISLPAIIDGTGKKIFGMHEEMEISYDLYEIVEKWFPFPVFMQNDADSAGCAEIKVRNSLKNTVYFFVSMSVGGAVMINGKPIYGRVWRAGEFGHMTLVPGGEKCYCGRRGCVNTYCSTNLLSELTGGNLTEFFRCVEEGNKECVEVWEKYMDSLALALHNLIAAFDMEVIIGGYLGQYIGPYMGQLESRIRKMDSYLPDIRFIQPAVLKYEASAIGAAGVFVERYLERI